MEPASPLEPRVQACFCALILRPFVAVMEVAGKVWETVLRELPVLAVMLSVRPGIVCPLFLPVNCTRLPVVRRKCIAQMALVVITLCFVPLELLALPTVLCFVLTVLVFQRSPCVAFLVPVPTTHYLGCVLMVHVRRARINALPCLPVLSTHLSFARIAPAKLHWLNVWLAMRMHLVLQAVLLIVLTVLARVR
jgi:hypothetical protein